MRHAGAAESPGTPFLYVNEEHRKWPFAHSHDDTFLSIGKQRICEQKNKVEKKNKLNLVEAVRSPTRASIGNPLFDRGRVASPCLSVLFFYAVSPNSGNLVITPLSSFAGRNGSYRKDNTRNAEGKLASRYTKGRPVEDASYTVLRFRRWS